MRARAVGESNLGVRKRDNNLLGKIEVIMPRETETERESERESHDVLTTFPGRCLQ
jgi:hypothetical protein